ncbi:MAG: tetratricopeptide repeat protein [Acidobacteria bacterium]|nr:MAG: tetratricopeptide repeat protein [Acidobacteriota bacterium]
MRIHVESRPAQNILMISLITGFVLATTWIVKTYFAYRAGHILTIESLQRATRLNPWDSTYHVQLGRLYQYSVDNPKPAEAIQQFQEAVKANPYDPNAWINLAAAREFQGDVSSAEEDLWRASALAPNLPQFQWTIGNYFLLQGNTQEAFQHLKVVLAGSRQYDHAVFNVAWKASGDAEQILHELIPNELPAEFSYLNYLVAERHFPEAEGVWKRIAATPETFKPQEASGYIDMLIKTGRVDAAYQVWTTLQGKGLVQTSPDGPNQNLIANGNFEDPLLNMGFGWRIQDVPGVYAAPDTAIFHSPGHSLSVQFTGKQNLDYHQVFQFVRVSANQAYELDAFMKTQDITSDSGPRLEVVDAYDPRALDKFTPGMIGTSRGWNPLNMKFKTGPQTQLILILLVRAPSKADDDTAITGRVWLDDVKITSATE